MENNKDLESLKRLVKKSVDLYPGFVDGEKFWKKRVEPILTKEILSRAIEEYKKDNKNPLVMQSCSELPLRKQWGTIPGRLACVFFRLQNILFKANIDQINVLIPLGSALNHNTRCCIAFSAEIGEGLNINHGDGVHIAGAGVKIGKNCTIFQDVNVGVNHKQKNAGVKSRPLIGDNVTLGAKSCVIGGIEIGDNVYVGAGTIVVKSVPWDCTVIGSHSYRVIATNDIVPRDYAVVGAHSYQVIAANEK